MSRVASVWVSGLPGRALGPWLSFTLILIFDKPISGTFQNLKLALAVLHTIVKLTTWKAALSADFDSTDSANLNDPEMHDWHKTSHSPQLPITVPF
jgi:hypothetical protein